MRFLKISISKKSYSCYNINTYPIIFWYGHIRKKMLFATYRWCTKIDSGKGRVGYWIHIWINDGNSAGQLEYLSVTGWPLARRPYLLETN